MFGRLIGVNLQVDLIGHEESNQTVLAKDSYLAISLSNVPFPTDAVPVDPTSSALDVCLVDTEQVHDVPQSIQSVSIHSLVAVLEPAFVCVARRCT